MTDCIQNIVFSHCLSRNWINYSYLTSGAETLNSVHGSEFHSDQLPNN